MKKIFFSFTLLSLLFVSGCSDDEGGNSSNAPECSITAPADGAVLDLYEDIVIKGTASDSDGTIAKVVLTVGGKAVAEVTEVPFEQTVAAKDLKEGTLKIGLSVEDDGGNTATDEITVVIQDQSEAPVCEIIAPAHGDELNVFAPFTIKGEGEAVSGEISKVTLKINDDVISGVITLPFEHTVAAETYPVGAYTITLEVENSRGKIAKDMVAITLADKNIAPVCSIDEPADGTSFEPTDAIVVKGTGSDEDGTIAKAVLKINDKAVESVAAVPFEYTFTDEQKKPGNVKITLEVTDNNGKTAVDEVTIVILGQQREFTDTRDGKVYKTVKLGEQEWFAENLAYLPQVNPGAEGSEDSGKEKAPMYYVYNYYGTDVFEAKATDEYKKTGVLYNYWATLNGEEPMADKLAVSTVQGPCPDGWHVPSMGEWWTLSKWVAEQIPDSEGVMQVDSDGTPENSSETRLIKNVIRKLKTPNGWSAMASGFWTEEFPDCNKPGTDDYGFGGYPSGARYSSDPSFYYYANGISNTNLYFWVPWWDAVTFPSNPGGGSVSFGVKYELSFNRGGTEPNRGYSIRCVKN